MPSGLVSPDHRARVKMAADGAGRGHSRPDPQACKTCDVFSFHSSPVSAVPKRLAQLDWCLALNKHACHWEAAGYSSSVYKRKSWIHIALRAVTEVAARVSERVHVAQPWENDSMLSGFRLLLDPKKRLAKQDNLPL